MSTGRGSINANRLNPDFGFFPSSEFDLPRDYTAKVPDLGLLRVRLLPAGVEIGPSDIRDPAAGQEAERKLIPALLTWQAGSDGFQPSDRLLCSGLPGIRTEGGRKDFCPIWLASKSA